MNRIKLLKRLDAFLGRVLTCLLPRPRSASPLPLERILFVRPGGIGDAVLLIPVLQAVQQKFPGAAIDILAEKRNAAIFGMCTVANKILLYDQGGLMTALRFRYDVVVDTEQWHRLSAVVARLIRSRVKIGYGTNERRKLFTHVVDYSHAKNEMESFFDLLRPLGFETFEVSFQPFLTIPVQERQQTLQLLGPLALRPFIVLFPGASIAERRWGTEKFRQLALRLNEHGYPVAVIGGPEDQAAGEELILGVDGMNLAGKTSLLGSAAILEKAALLVSGDSGMLHVGVGLGIPTVSLFGSGISAKWAPKGDRHVVINKGLPCSPCTRFGYTPPCPIGTHCLVEITAEEVLSAVLSQLKPLS